MSSRLTFRKLDKALTALGFVKQQNGTHILYNHSETKTLITLPPYRASQAVDPAHESVVRKMVVGRGVAPEKRIQALLAHR